MSNVSPEPRSDQIPDLPPGHVFLPPFEGRQRCYCPESFDGVKVYHSPKVGWVGLQKWTPAAEILKEKI